MCIEFKTHNLTTKAKNMNNTIITYGHPCETVMIMDSLKTCGVWNRHQWIFDPAEGLSVAVSKLQNKFRDRNNKRLSAREMMRISHTGSDTTIQTAKVKTKFLVAMHALFQTSWIFFSYTMDDGSSIMDNVD